MKQILTVILIAFATSIYGQNANDFLQSGILKHNAKEYNEAIKEYSKAIKIDKNFKDAYFNRGVCEQAINDLKTAKKDFDKTIELDPKFAKAYYSRATLSVTNEKYLEALPDLDKVIEIDPSLPNALNLRGQIRAQSGNKKGACEDFNLSKSKGDTNANKYLQQFCGNEQQSGESLMLNWPESENWKVGSSQENKEMAMLELIHSNETLEKWTEFGSMTSIKGAKNVPMDKAMNLMFDQAKLNSPKAKLTFIEKDEKTEYPWIIFTIENPSFKNDNTPESQLWYIVQGKQALYTNFRAVKQKTVSTELKEKWIKFFKTGRVMSK